LLRHRVAASRFQLSTFHIIAPHILLLQVCSGKSQQGEPLLLALLELSSHIKVSWQWLWLKLKPSTLHVCALCLQVCNGKSQQGEPLLLALLETLRYCQLLYPLNVKHPLNLLQVCSGKSQQGEPMLLALLETLRACCLLLQFLETPHHCHTASQPAAGVQRQEPVRGAAAS
jgi:hypothetical protein